MGNTKREAFLVGFTGLLILGVLGYSEIAGAAEVMGPKRPVKVVEQSKVDEHILFTVRNEGPDAIMIKAGQTVHFVCDVQNTSCEPVNDIAQEDQEMKSDLLLTRE